MHMQNICVVCAPRPTRLYIYIIYTYKYIFLSCYIHVYRGLAGAYSCSRLFPVRHVPPKHVYMYI